MCGQKVESSDQTNFNTEWIHTREYQLYLFARLVQLFIFVGTQSQLGCHNKNNSESVK